MKMFNRLFVITSLVLVAGMAQAAQIKIDLVSTAYANYSLTGPGVNMSGAGQVLITANTNAAGTCTLTVGSQSEASVLVQFAVDGGGNISNVQWKDADGSLTGGTFQTLSTTFYTLGQGGKRINLLGQDVVLNHTTNDIATWTRPQLAGTPTNNTFKLLPGDVFMQSSGFQCKLRIEIQSTGLPSSAISFSDMTVTPVTWENLHSDWASVSNNTVNLHGKSLTVNLTEMPNGIFNMTAIKTAKANVNGGATASLAMMPGRLDGTILNVVNGSPVGYAALRIGVVNSTRDYTNLVYWSDLSAGSTTFDVLGPEYYYTTPGVIFLRGAPSFSSLVMHPNYYAVPKREPDGFVYKVTNSLKFLFEGEYASGNLSYRIYKWDRTDALTSYATLTRNYGDNRYSVDVSALASDEYMLEIVNEKSEKFFLRFAKN